MTGKEVKQQLLIWQEGGWHLVGCTVTLLEVDVPARLCMFFRTTRLSCERQTSLYNSEAWL